MAGMIAFLGVLARGGYDLLDLLNRLVVSAAPGFPGGLRYYAGQIVAAIGHKNDVSFHTSVRNTRAGGVSSIVAKIAPVIAQSRNPDRRCSAHRAPRRGGY
jgi:hypothetical protein